MSAQYHASREWYSLLAELTTCIGSEQFHSQLATSFQSVSGYDSTYIVAFHKGKRPIQIFDNVSKEYKDATAAPYIQGAYLLDPFYVLFRDGIRDGQFRLKDVAPDSFFKSEYFLSFYGATRLKDETGIFVPIGNDAAILISMGIRPLSQKITESQRNSLSTILPLMVELFIKHWQLFTSRQDESSDTIGKPLDTAFNNFGRNHLSERECEVVRMILKGYSSKAIARLLKISPDTVNVYRKRVHVKLNISSQAELFSLFLEAVSHVQFDTDEDPLTLYFSKT